MSTEKIARSVTPDDEDNYHTATDPHPSLRDLGTPEEWYHHDILHEG